ncbi:MAG: hypothetical protein HQL15_07370 [Candidatus Omnitrophica bacterium]|nr:hypothetical protein [Candidatus Omnitrophota bacterium]
MKNTFAIVLTAIIGASVASVVFAQEAMKIDSLENKEAVMQNTEMDGMKMDAMKMKEEATEGTNEEISEIKNEASEAAAPAKAAY